MPTPLTHSFSRSTPWLAVALLATLHLALWLGIESPWTLPLLISHLGFFLLWQPLWRGESKLRPGSIVFIGGASLVALLWLNWWVLAFWVTGLFSLVGGRVFAFHAIWQRWRYLLAMAYLLGVLLLWITPHLFNLPLVVGIAGDLMDYVLPALLLIMALIPTKKEPAEAAQIVDFIYSLLLFLLLTLLILGSLAFMTLAHVDYFEALLGTLFILAAMLLVMSWLWNPRLGFSGLQPMFSRYLLNIGTPFEEWLKHLTEASQQESNPGAFLERAVANFTTFPWLSGMSWVSREGHGNLGVSSKHRVDVVDHDLHLTVFSRMRISPSTELHVQLLTRLLGNFYQAKRREQQLREIARLQAIYETGSRLTHDLKNMLQSLLSLSSVAQLQPDKAQPILQQQLPVLTQRIELILGKLKSPQPEDDAAKLPLTTWWEGLRQRYQHAGLIWTEPDHIFSLPEGGGCTIPSAMFDCVADNLIDNACHKRLREPGIAITVSLCLNPFSLGISDSGSPIPPGVAHQLLNTVMPSEDGLGVGLYQAGRWAEQMGFSLTLAKNIEGAVGFELKKE
jgi:signal transduction histidine kinase